MNRLCESEYGRRRTIQNKEKRKFCYVRISTFSLVKVKLKPKKQQRRTFLHSSSINTVDYYSQKFPFFWKLCKHISYLLNLYVIQSYFNQCIRLSTKIKNIIFKFVYMVCCAWSWSLFFFFLILPYSCRYTIYSAWITSTLLLFHWSGYIFNIKQ